MASCCVECGQAMAVTLPEKLRRVRQDRRFTRKYVERVARLGAGSLSRYEQGKRTPSLNVLVRLAGALGVTVGWLLHESMEHTT